MNKVALAYYPVYVYTLLLLAVWLLSWFAGVAGVFVSGEVLVENLVSAEGVRWALRSASYSLESAPWGVAVLCVVCVGLIVGSGLLHTVCEVLRGRGLVYHRRKAGSAALVVFLLCVILIFLCTVSPWHLLMGVSGDFSSSPLAKGWLLVLFIVVLAVSAIHGAVCGNYRMLSDVVRGVCDVFVMFAPAFVAMVPASGLVACLDYVGLLAGDDYVSHFVAALLYLSPFLYVAVLRGRDFLLLDGGQ